MKLIKRIYSMSDAVLNQITSRVLIAGTRDIAHLAAQGVDVVFLTRVRDKQTEFNAKETDEEMMGALRVTTQSRDRLKKRTLERLHQGTMKSKFFYGEESEEYRNYALGAISHDTNAVIIRKATRALKLFLQQQPDLVGEGMTPEFVQEFAVLLVDYTNSVDDQVDAVMERNKMMRERTKLGNELYKLLNILAEKGKICWMYSNEALYNDYIIYTHNTPEGQTIASIVGAKSVVSHEMADVKPTTKIKITNKGTTNLEVFFATEPTDITGEPVILVLAGGKSKYLAREMGYDKAAGKTCFNVFNGGDVQGSYKVHWR